MFLARERRSPRMWSTSTGGVAHHVAVHGGCEVGACKGEAGFDGAEEGRRWGVAVGGGDGDAFGEDGEGCLFAQGTASTAPMEPRRRQVMEARAERTVHLFHMKATTSGSRKRSKSQSRRRASMAWMRGVDGGVEFAEVDVVEELVHVDDAAFGVEVCGDAGGAAEDGVATEAVGEGVEVGDAVEEREDCGVGADGGGEVFDGGGELIGLGAEEDEVEGLGRGVEFGGGEEVGLDGEVGFGFDDVEAVAAELSGAALADEEGDVRGRLCGGGRRSSRRRRRRR